MGVAEFSLMPFPGEEVVPGLTVSGSLGRRADALYLRCAFRGPLAELAIASPEPFPARKDRLWEETCLELFLGENRAEGYWEFNLSPAGHWNVYRFSSRREGMREEPAFASLPFLARREPDGLRFSLDVETGIIIPPGRDLEAAVAAVVRTASGRTSHWALDHAGPRPDFHRRTGFTLLLASSRA